MCTCRRPTAGVNLLSNPGFDGSAQDWADFGMYSSMNDADGCAQSGSADSSSLSASISQCVPATAGLTYSLTFRFKGINTTSMHTGMCYAVFYRKACPNPISDFDYATGGTDDAFASSSGAWIQAPRVNTVAPAGTVAATVHCVPMQGFGYYDQIYFGTSTTTSF